jgi:hypothetical protein
MALIYSACARVVGSRDIAKHRMQRRDCTHSRHALKARVEGAERALSTVAAAAAAAAAAVNLFLFIELMNTNRRCLHLLRLLLLLKL